VHKTVAMSRKRCACKGFSPIDENRNRRMREYFCGYASKHYRRNPAPSVRSHHNEVAAFLLCGIDYRFVWMIFNHLFGLALHTSGLCITGNPIQY